MPEHPGSRIHEPLMIGIAGGSSSGKTEIAEMMARSLSSVDEVRIIDQKSFHLDRATHPEVQKLDYNFDHPDAFDFDLMLRTLTALKHGNPVQIPWYDTKTMRRTWSGLTIGRVHVVMFVGVFVLYWKEIRELLDLRLFINVDDDLRLSKALATDAHDSTAVMEVVERYVGFVKPSHDRFVVPTMRYADLVVPRGADNRMGRIALEQLVRLRLQQRGMICFHPQTAGERFLRLATVQKVEAVQPEVKQILTVFAKVGFDRITRETMATYLDRLTNLMLTYADGAITTEDKLYVSVLGVSDWMETGLKDRNRSARVAKFVMTPAAGDDKKPPVMTSSPPRRASVSSISSAELAAAHPEEDSLHCVWYPQIPESCSCVVLWPTLSSVVQLRQLLCWLFARDIEPEQTLVVSMWGTPDACLALIDEFPSVQIVTGVVSEDSYHINSLGYKVHCSYFGLNHEEDVHGYFGPRGDPVRVAS